MSAKYGTESYEKNIARNTNLIRGYTLGLYEPLWANNVAINLRKARIGRNVNELRGEKPSRLPALVIGNGPSLEKFDQLKTLREHPAYDSHKQVIIACDAALKKCLKHNIVPDYVTNLDAMQKTAEFFKGLSKSMCEGIKAIICITAHPDTVAAIEKLGMEIYWYCPIWDEPFKKEMSVTRFLHYMTGQPPSVPLPPAGKLDYKGMLHTMGNVGGFSWYFAGYLGCDPVALLGIDYGYPPETPIEETQYYLAYKDLVKLQNEELRKYYEAEKESRPDAVEPELITIEGCYRLVKNPDTGAEVLVGLNWDSYREQFLTIQRQIHDFTAGNMNKTINLSPESSLFGPHIDFWSLEDWLEMMV